MTMMQVFILDVDVDDRSHDMNFWARLVYMEQYWWVSDTRYIVYMIYTIVRL